MIVESDQRLTEDMPLEQLLEVWIKLVLWSGIQPAFHEMVHANLTLAELIVLRMLQGNSLSVADVAECMSITQSAASRAVDRLVHDGYVERQENPTDRRQKLLTLAPLGQNLLDSIDAKVAQEARPIVDALSAAEREQFGALLAKMIASQGPWPSHHTLSAPLHPRPNDRPGQTLPTVVARARHRHVLPKRMIPHIVPRHSGDRAGR